ncbi:MAG: NAD-dependent epimerase/dehydratase family protein [Eubacterium sp.]
MDLENKFDPILQEDIEILSDKIHNFNEFSDKTVLITGATGLLGSLLIKSFLCCNRMHNDNIKIIGFAKNENNVKSAFGELLNRDNFKIVYGNIMEPIKIDDDIDYIMHAAGITGNSKNHILHPTVTINTAVLGTHNILELAKEKKISGMVYFSSWEIYGITDPDKECIYENDYGYIDVMEVRRCHGESKRLCENMCLAYSSEFNVPVSIGRIPLTFGPGVRAVDNRVFAQFARSVINKTDIVLKTTGETLRNHCYTRDALNALLTIMVKGERCESYNIVNPDTAMTIIDMAKLVSNLFEDSKINVKIELDDPKKYGYNPNLKCLLNSDKLQNLGWKPEVGIEEMYRRMILSMKRDNG